MNNPRFALAALVGVFGMVATAPAYVFYGVTAGGSLVSFDNGTPGIFNSSVAITGLQNGESLVGLDFRPSGGALYAIGSTSRMYTLNRITGLATQVGAAGAFTLSGTRFGVDFNPVPDRLRVTSNLEQNLRLNPNDGTLTMMDGNLSYAAGDPNVGANPNVVASGYTNSFAGAATTTLYDIDSNLDILVTQNPPNNGTLNTVGALGINFSDVSDMDILFDGGLNFGFASTNIVGGPSSFYTLNLGTGAATLVGNFSTTVNLIAAQPVPEPATLIVLAIGGVAALSRKRRKN
ncbi:MAG: DUF4394 domain-containing protein [Chlorobia bacterium]|nr:DUF4394 domain-containing protein [Fimbriimonadaceae bacterium]